MELENLNQLVESAQKLQRLLKTSPEILECLRLLQNPKTVEILMPIKPDVTAGEAAKVLGVNKSAIYSAVSAKLLTPMFTPHSNIKKFWLSDVKKLAVRRCGNGD